MEHERYEELLDNLLEGELSEGQLIEFDAILERDQALAQDASDRLSEHRLLGFFYQPFDDEDFSRSVMDAARAADCAAADSAFNASVGIGKTSMRSHGSSKVGWLVGLTFLAASLLIGLGLIAWHRPAVESITAIPFPQPVVATLLLAEQCDWQGDPPAEGARLAKGPLQLKSGLAVLRFDGGAEVVLQGNCLLELLSAGGIQVDRGDIIVRATDEATGFRVQTPSSELIDLGTEFSVEVGGGGETKLNVLEGKVSIRPLKHNVARPKLLQQGSSVIVASSTSDPEQAPHDALRFNAVIRNANPRSRADLRFAYEGFFYNEGALPLSKSTKGNGWRGPWRKRSLLEGYRADQDTTNSLDIVHGQMNVTWGVRGGELGMLKMPPGKTVRLREMKQSIDLSQDGIYFVSLMVREPDHSQRDAKARPRESVRLTLRSKDDYYGELLSFGVSQQLKPRVLTGQGVGFLSSSDTPTNQTTLWIGKVVARATGEDEVYFRIFGEDEELVNDELNWAEPSQWHVASRNLDLSADLNLVVLTSEGLAPRYIDELRIGPTWRSVAPLRP